MIFKVLPYSSLRHFIDFGFQRLKFDGFKVFLHKSILCFIYRRSLVFAHDPDETLHINTITRVNSTNFLLCFGCKIL